MTTSQARERLLAAAVEQAMRGGIADMSLRELAAAIGTSHRMLLYHFGSREGLLTAVAGAVEEAQRAVVSGWGISAADDARGLWQHFSDPQLWPAERLFFELYAQALLGRPGTEGFLDSAIEPWITALVPAFIGEAGLDAKTARAEARLAVAVTRGLLLDLLATGDRDGVTEAFERYLQHTEPIGPRAANHPATPASRPAQPAATNLPAAGSLPAVRRLAASHAGRAEPERP
jgi:AcrR family transcriptional regulator